MTIFDLITSQETAAYWNEVKAGKPPFLGEELLGEVKQLGTTIKFIKGASATPVMLKQSAYDAKAVPRERIGFDTVVSEMPFFKESLYIDEALQRDLNNVLATGNQPYIDSVFTRIMNDNVTLLDAARLVREVMVWQALTTGAISLASNGQNYTVDYGVPSDHKGTSAKAWSDSTADIIGSVRDYQDIVEEDTGVRPTRMIVSRTNFNNILENDKIKKTLIAAANIEAYLSEAKLKSYFSQELGVDLAIYDKRYKTSAGTMAKFVPDDTAILLPEIQLGEMTFGETPEESSMYAGLGGDVSITDLGVAITAMKIDDPVTVETKVSQTCMPSLPHIDKIFIIDTDGA